MKTRKISRYGWRPDTPDVRDHSFVIPELDKVPTKVDLRPQCPAVYDQGQLGSCTANAINGAYEFDLLKQGAADFMPSRLFVYYNERVIEGTVKQDAGAEIRDGIKTIAQAGVCTEKTWPYKISKFASKPSTAAYKEALAHTAVTYKRLNQTSVELKACLASDSPVVFGFSVYESFESAAVAKSGNVPMPKKSEQLLGGHAVLLVGYDDTKGRWIVRNSWGTGWGQVGYFTMPYAYLTDTNLASDFWSITTVKG